jgi:hypothetical protein
MSSKTWIFIGLIAGSYLGGLIPTFWGDSYFSYSSVIGNFVGGASGIWVGYKIYQNLS